VSQQRTIAQKIACQGIGLHSGEPAGLTLVPAGVGAGVVFVCRQGDGVIEIPAAEDFVSSTANATSLSRKGARVATVEHLLATLRARGVDNVRVEVEGPEIPAMDGSAASFDDLIRSAGLVAQPQLRPLLQIRHPVSYTDGLRSIRIEPSRVFRVSYGIEFQHPAIGRQTLEIEDLTPACFEREIARARTFGFLEEVDALRRAGLARGASLENTVVLDASGVMNEGGLRWPDEFVRHKVLDLLGDLALIGYPIRGHVQVERGGHAIHRALLQELRQHPEAWQLVAPESPSSLPGVPTESLSSL
jgi:UDP-3-O-[3-hydroxymyristoyl] N-acetylglucosamine deacetylase